MVKEDNFICRASLVFLFALIAQPSTAQWAKSLSGGGGDLSVGTKNRVVVADNDSLATYDSDGALAWRFDLQGVKRTGADEQSNVYAAGQFSGTMDVDPGSGEVNLTSQGDDDIYVTSYDASGTYRQELTLTNDSGWTLRDLAVDEAGSVYLTGYFSGSFDADPSSQTDVLSSTGGSDIFVVKYDSQAELVWAFSLAGSFDEHYTWSTTPSLAVEPNGGLYLTGPFQETVDFDPGDEIIFRTSADGRETFLTKYSTDTGEHLWTVHPSGNDGESHNSQSHDVAVDAAGNVYMTGYFDRSTDFDPSADEAVLTSPGFFDAFVVSYDAEGAYRWAGDIGGPGRTEANGFALALDDQQNVYLTGYFYNSSEGDVDFDPGHETEVLAYNGEEEAFVAKYSSSGVYQNAFPLGARYADRGKEVVTDADHVYVLGKMHGTIDFDPAGGEKEVTVNEAFLAQYNQVGEAFKTDVETPEGHPQVLTSPHPNPFAGRTRFRLELRQTQEVRIAVFNVLGRRVARLHEGRLSGGQSHPFEFDGADRPSGVYLIRVQGEHFTTAQQAVLTK